MTTASLATDKPLQPGDLVTLFWNNPAWNTGLGVHRMRAFNQEGETVHVMPGDVVVFMGSNGHFFEVLHPDLGPVEVVAFNAIKLIPIVASEEN